MNYNSNLNLNKICITDKFTIFALNIDKESEL